MSQLVQHLAFAVCAIVIASQSAIAGNEHAEAICDYLIVHTAELADAAEDWAGYRTETGRAVRLLAIEPSDNPTAQRGDIRDAIRAMVRAQTDDRQQRFCVLLLGDADAIPAWSFKQTDPVLQTHRAEDYISDHPYQCMNPDDELPDIALGRIPARTLEEAQAALQKIMRYESSTPPVALRQRLQFVAGEGRFGPFDALLESLFRVMIGRYVPPACDIDVMYANPQSLYCPPPDLLQDEIARRITEPALLFTYVGHGSPRKLDALHLGGERFDMFDVDAAGSLPQAAEPRDIAPLAFMSCCSVGWFDLDDGQHSLAEAMLFHPAMPAAVLAGSRLTHPYANAVIQKDIMHGLLVDRASTIGELDLHATRSLLHLDSTDREIDLIAYPIAAAGRWHTSLSGLRRMHMRLYNLLGDPAMRIHHVDGRISHTELHENGRLTARVANVKTGTVTITLETAVASCVDANALHDVRTRSDEALVDALAHNFARINQRVLWTVKADIVDGAIDVTLDQPLPANVALIKLRAEGVDDNGKPASAAGAISVSQLQK